MEIENHKTMKIIQKKLNYWNDLESPTDHNFVTSLKRYTHNTTRRTYNLLMSYLRLVLARRRILCQTVSHLLVYPYFEGLCMRDFCVFTVLSRNCWARRKNRQRFIQSKAFYWMKLPWFHPSQFRKFFALDFSGKKTIKVSFDFFYSIAWIEQKCLSALYTDNS